MLLLLSFLPLAPILLPPSLAAQPATPSPVPAQPAAPSPAPDLPSSHPAHRPRLVGYFGQWGAYDGIFPAALVHSGAAAQLDQLNYAQGFVTGGHCSVADPKADLNLTFTAANSVDGRPDPALTPFHGNLRQLILLKRRYPHLKVLISLEGQARDFAADAQPGTRASFAQSCVDLFLRGGFVPSTPQPTLTASTLTTPQPPPELPVQPTAQPQPTVISTTAQPQPAVISNGAQPKPAVISTEAQRSGETPVFAPAPSPAQPPPSSAPNPLLVVIPKGSASPPLSPRQAREATRLRHDAQTLFDGIDLDWEYPAAEDAANFLALLTELRHRLDQVRPGLLLTVALGPSPRMYPGVDLAAVARLVDEVGIMNYDYNGPWNHTTGLIAPLRTPNDGLHGGSVERTLLAYHQAGVPFADLLMGLPFYGYGWHAVSPGTIPAITPATPPPTAARNPALPDPDPTLPGLYLPGDSIRGDRPFRFFAPLLAAAVRLPPPATAAQAPPAPSPATPQPFRLFRDPLSQAPWLYNGDTFWTFDDTTSVRAKATFARDHHLGGLMIWELGNDSPHATLTRAARAALSPHPHSAQPANQPR